MSIRKRKSIIALLLVALMCFAAAGCSAPASKETTPAPTPASTETKAPSSTSGLRPEGVPADFPNKEIQWIYAFGPGSPMDAYFRMLADKIQKMEGWKNGMIVTYKEGASGRIGWSAVAEAKPDGYTIGFCPSAMLISGVSEKVPYGYDKLTYVMNTMTDPGAIAVVADSKYQTLKDLVEEAKARPGKVVIGVTSTIGQEGLTIKLIEKAAGVQFKMIAFNSEAETTTALLGKHVDALCLNVTDFTTLVEEKKVRVVATGNEKRSEFLPDVPTYKESGYDVLQVNMRSIGGPKDMPEPIRQYLENCFMAAAADPEIQAKVKEMKIPVDTLSGADTKAKFTTIGTNLEKLWTENPWQ